MVGILASCRHHKPALFYKILYKLNLPCLSSYLYGWMKSSGWEKLMRPILLDRFLVDIDTMNHDILALFCNFQYKFNLRLNLSSTLHNWIDQWNFWYFGQMNFNSSQMIQYQYQTHINHCFLHIDDPENSPHAINRFEQIRWYSRYQSVLSNLYVAYILSKPEKELDMY